MNLFNKLIKKSDENELKLKETKNILEFRGTTHEIYNNEYIQEYLIGSGSFGKVYKVNEKTTGDSYAIKIISGIIFKFVIYRYELHKIRR